MDDLSRNSNLLSPGAELHGRYRILSVIGRGGMSAVYQAEHTLLSKRVAIKEMHSPSGGDSEVEEAVQRFQNEARTLAKLEHRYFPDVTDFFSENDRYYLVMDYVDGETLEDLVTRTAGFLSEASVVRWASQLCDVLSYLHSQSPPVVFRDLKPSNIMIDREGQVKLIDFGIARFFKPGKSSDTQSMGTAGYSAPEQYGTGQTDARSDIYSLGACLHYLLTRRDPTAAPFTFPPVRELNPHVSANTERVVARCLAMRPEDRYSSAAEVKKALTPPAPESETTFLTRQPRPAPVHPMAPPPSLPPVKHSNPWLYVLIPLILLLAAGIGFMLYQMRGPSQVTVPNVVGMDRDAANAALTQNQLGLSYQGAENSDLPDGQVTRQEPAEGASLPAGTPVKLWFSKGKAVNVAAIPDISRLPLDRAKQALEAVGLELGDVTRENSNAVPKDFVVRSDPPAGRKMEAHQPVGVVVSDGPPPPPPAAITPAPAPTAPVVPGGEPGSPAGQPNFDVRVSIPGDGKKHQVQIAVQQADGPHEVVNEQRDHDVKETIAAPNQAAISAKVDGQPVTPEIRPVTQGSVPNGAEIAGDSTAGSASTP